MKKKSLGETVGRAVIGIVLADVISALIYLFLNAILRAVFYGVNTVTATLPPIILPS